MQETNLNPFTSSKTATAYAGADPVYALSTEAVIKFVSPLANNIADLGAGTGVSSAIILDACKPESKLTVIEPSEAMIAEAKHRLGAKAQYLNLGVDELPTSSFDLIYALNCFHLFPDHNNAAQQINNALSKNGVLVFNLSSPSYRFKTISEDELNVLYANLDFYTELHARSNGQYMVLASTVQLLTSLVTAISYSGREHELIEGLNISALELIERSRSSARGLYSQEELANIFKAANMDLVDYTEVLIRVTADYQRNIWRMMAKAFISEEAVEELVLSVQLPSIVPIRQAIFKLCKQ